MKGFPSAIAPLVGQRCGVLAPAGEPRQVVTPYLDSKEAVVYLRLGSLSALYSHIRENKLPTCRCGGDLRFDVRELDAWMHGMNSIELVRQKRA